MREIEFRGLTKDGKWVYGNYSYLKHDDGREGHWIVEIEPTYVRTGPVFERGWTHLQYEVRPETVGQYTGLKDKNGVKLAAGDKYKWLGWEVRDGKQIRPERIETIRNDTPEHWIEDCHRLWCISTGNSQGTVEVIGNIHEEAKP